MILLEYDKRIKLSMFFMEKGKKNMTKKNGCNLISCKYHIIFM